MDLAGGFIQLAGVKGVPSFRERLEMDLAAGFKQLAGV